MCYACYHHVQKAPLVSRNGRGSPGADMLTSAGTTVCCILLQCACTLQDRQAVTFLRACGKNLRLITPNMPMTVPQITAYVHVIPKSSDLLDRLRPSRRMRCQNQWFLDPPPSLISPFHLTSSSFSIKLATRVYLVLFLKVMQASPAPRGCATCLSSMTGALRRSAA